ncbi:hypothetical protein [Phenylobacterium sp.]|uniref:hypothetical protein n=1 Tax=Phenylobacterium sp. TaxID=1871053 RepID=UPI003BAA8EBF
MRHAIVISLAVAGLALTACSKSEQAQTGEHAKAAAAKIGEATKEVATSPEMKDLGTDVKEGAVEAGAVAKDALTTAGAELKAGAAKAGDKAQDAAATADAKIDKAAADAKK